MSWPGPCETLVPTASGVPTLRRLHPFGQALHRFVHRASVFGLLPDGTWLAGGCWPLARALHAFLGTGELWVVESQFRTGGRGPQHVVLRLDDWHLDGDGIARADELLRRMRAVEGYVAPSLRPAAGLDLRQLGFGDYPELEAPLLAAFRQRFPRDRAVWQSLGRPIPRLAARVRAR